MPVTLNQIINELERIQKSRRKKFDRYVLEGRMTPYTRDSKLAVMDCLLEKCRLAKLKKTLLADELSNLNT